MAWQGRAAPGRSARSRIWLVRLSLRGPIIAKSSHSLRAGASRTASTDVAARLGRERPEHARAGQQE